MQNRTLEQTGLSKPGKTYWVMGTGPGLAHQDSAGVVSEWVWNQTEPFLCAKPRPLVGYPDPLLPLQNTYLLPCLAPSEICH